MKDNDNSREFFITDPQVGDEVAVGIVHKQAWLETYPDDEKGITTDILHTLVDHVATEKGAEFRKKVYADAKSNPTTILYKVVRNHHNKVVGFMHGTKTDNQNNLGAIYLLDEAKGHGIGDALMQTFLSWADKDKPCLLSVLTHNTRAIRFYEKYGFRKVEGSDSLYKNTIPHFEMIRAVQ